MKNKIKIRFVNGLLSSPILEVDYSRGLNEFLGRFLSSLTHHDPDKIMIDFITAALNTKGRVYPITPVSVAKSTSDSVHDILVRKSDIVEFVYHKDDGSSSWRKIDVIEEDNLYIKGNDVDDDLKFKCFKKSLIVGKRIIRLGKK